MSEAQQFDLSWGRLSERPLAAILLAARKHGATGVVKLNLPHGTARVFLRSGQPVGALVPSGWRPLAQVLVQHGLVDVETVDRALPKLEQGRAIQEVLLEMGAIDERGLNEALSLQLRDHLRLLSKVTDGRWEYAHEALPGWTEKLSVDADAALAEAMSAPEAESFIVDLLCELGPRWLRLTEQGRSVAELFTPSDEERAALSVLEDRGCWDDFSGIDPRRAQLLCAGLYALGGAVPIDPLDEARERARQTAAQIEQQARALANERAQRLEAEAGVELEVQRERKGGLLERIAEQKRRASAKEAERQTLDDARRALETKAATMLDAVRAARAQRIQEARAEANELISNAEAEAQRLEDEARQRAQEAWRAAEEERLAAEAQAEELLQEEARHREVVDRHAAAQAALREQEERFETTSAEAQRLESEGQNELELLRVRADEEARARLEQATQAGGPGSSSPLESQAMEQLSQSRARSEELQRRLAEERLAREQVEAEHRRLEEARAVLGPRIDFAEQQCAELRKSIEEQAHRLRLEAESRVVHERVSRAEQEAADEHRRAEDLAQKLAEESEARASLERELAHQREASQAAGAAFERFEGEVASLERQRIEAEEELARSRAAAEREEQERLLKAEKEAEEERRRSEELSQKLAEELSVRTSLEGELSQERETYKRIESSLAQVKERLTLVEQRRTEIEDELTRVRADLEKAAQPAHREATGTDSLQEQSLTLARMSEARANAERELAEVREARLAVDAELARSNEALSEVERRRAELDEELKRLRAAAAHAEQERVSNAKREAAECARRLVEENDAKASAERALKEERAALHVAETEAATAQSALAAAASSLAESEQMLVEQGEQQQLEVPISFEPEPEQASIETSEQPQLEEPGSFVEPEQMLVEQGEQQQLEVPISFEPEPEQTSIETSEQPQLEEPEQMLVEQGEQQQLEVPISFEPEPEPEQTSIETSEQPQLEEPGSFVEPEQMLVEQGEQQQLEVPISFEPEPEQASIETSEQPQLEEPGSFVEPEQMLVEQGEQQLAVPGSETSFAGLLAGESEGPPLVLELPNADAMEPQPVPGSSLAPEPEVELTEADLWGSEPLALPSGPVELELPQAFDSQVDSTFATALGIAPPPKNLLNVSDAFGAAFTDLFDASTTPAQDEEQAWLIEGRVAAEQRRQARRNEAQEKAYAQGFFEPTAILEEDLSGLLSEEPIVSNLQTEEQPAGGFIVGTNIDEVDANLLERAWGNQVVEEAKTDPVMAQEPAPVLPPPLAPTPVVMRSPLQFDELELENPAQLIDAPKTEPSQDPTRFLELVEELTASVELPEFSVVEDIARGEMVGLTPRPFVVPPELRKLAKNDQPTPVNPPASLTSAAIEKLIPTKVSGPFGASLRVASEDSWNAVLAPDPVLRPTTTDGDDGARETEVTDKDEQARERRQRLLRRAFGNLGTFQSGSTPPPSPTPALTPPPSPAAPSFATPVATDAPSSRDLEFAKRVEELSQALAQGRDLFSLFGLPRTATREQAKAAYIQLVRVIHPDQAPISMPHLVPKMTSVFNAIREGIEVLQDDERRKAYLERLSYAPPAEPTAKKEGADDAELAEKQAETHLRKKEYLQASQYFAKAYALTKNPTMLAQEAWSIYMDPARKVDLSVVKTKLEEALRLDGRNDRACYAMGVIHRVEGDLVRAERFFKLATSANPRNTEAATELRIIEMRRRK